MSFSVLAHLKQCSSSYPRTSRSIAHNLLETSSTNNKNKLLTSFGLTSTISSGTKKINAFIFLAIEIANFAFCLLSSYSPLASTGITSDGSTIPGRIASRRSRKKSPVVIDGSLNERMGWTEELCAVAVVFAHLRRSWSERGRWEEESEERVLVMFSLRTKDRRQIPG